MSDDLDPSRRDAVAGLIARVGTIGRELEGLKADFEQLRTGGDVGELRTQVEALAAMVRRLADEKAAETEGVRATWWPDMEAGEERSSALRALGAWVDEVIRCRHPEAYKDLQPCWYWHADIVDELTALRAAWFAAYRDAESSATAAIEWHDRWLPGRWQLQSSDEGPGLQGRPPSATVQTSPSTTRPTSSGSPRPIRKACEPSCLVASIVGRVETSSTLMGSLRPIIEPTKFVHWEVNWDRGTPKLGYRPAKTRHCVAS